MNVFHLFSIAVVACWGLFLVLIFRTVAKQLVEQLKPKDKEYLVKWKYISHPDTPERALLDENWKRLAKGAKRGSRAFTVAALISLALMLNQAYFAQVPATVIESFSTAASEDTYVSEAFPDSSYGSSPYLTVGWWNNTSPFVILVKIPSSSIAFVRMSFDAIHFPKNYNVTLFVTACVMNLSWSEGSATWNSLWPNSTGIPSANYNSCNTRRVFTDQVEFTRWQIGANWDSANATMVLFAEMGAAPETVTYASSEFPESLAMPYFTFFFETQGTEPPPFLDVWQPLLYVWATAIGWRFGWKSRRKKKLKPHG